MHCNTGHPGDEALGSALDKQEHTKSRKLYEICSASAENKTQVPDEVTPEGVLPPYPGYTLIG